MLCLSLVVMRCQPLRRALALFQSSSQSPKSQAGFEVLFSNISGDSMSTRFCEKCGKNTEHKEVMKQKPSKYGKSKREQFKAFLDGFFSSSAASLPGGVSLELTDRHVVCAICGSTTLENHGEQFQ
ncbi:pullulanase [Vibrio cholerae]|nr:pullulanase [Vibrio cholerae]